VPLPPLLGSPLTIFLLLLRRPSLRLRLALDLYSPVLRRNTAAIVDIRRNANNSVLRPIFGLTVVCFSSAYFLRVLFHSPSYVMYGNASVYYILSGICTCTAFPFPLAALHIAIHLRERVVPLLVRLSAAGIILLPMCVLHFLIPLLSLRRGFVSLFPHADDVCVNDARSARAQRQIYTSGRR
jgi:hypothetical protein